MTPEQAEFFDKMEVMFGTPGWKTFVDDVKGFADALTGGAFNYSTFDAYNVDRGRWQAFQQIINYENMCDQLKARLQDEPEADTNA